MARTAMKAIPKDWPVQPLTRAHIAHWEKAQDWQRTTNIATCGHCGFSWEDSIITSMTPAAARCPFEPFHVHRKTDSE